METTAASSNEFNLKLLHAYRASFQDGNIFYSPFSIASALAMLSAGAKGNTKKEIEKVLCTEGMDRMHEGFRAVYKAIQELPGNAVLNIANILAVERNYEILSEYSGNLKENYKADSRSLDFVNNAEAARQELNQLIESFTQEKIKDLFPPGAIDSDTRLVLANAIYFKGLWNKQFNKSVTEKGTFHTNNNQEIMVDMMYRKGDYRYFCSKDLKADFLEIPYLGNKFDMIIILPKAKDGLSFVEKNITVDMINNANKKMQMDEVQLTLPRFKLEESLSLKNVLLSMGMKEAFTNNADLSGINGQKELFVSAALHKAFVEVNEEGTEAAAATGLVMALCSLRMCFRFTVDHPFMFFIREKESGLILFTGSVHTLQLSGNV